MNSTKSLKDVAKELGDNYHNSDKELEKIEKTLKSIKNDYKGVMKDNKYEITDALEDVYNAKSEMYSLKVILDVLAETTISKVDKLIRTLNAVEKQTDNTKITRYLERIVKRMTSLLSRSDVLLNEALEKYEVLTKNLNTIKLIKYLKNKHKIDV